MSYAFPSDVQQLIHQQMSRGHYRSEDDLLRDALRALAQQQSAVEPDPIAVEGIRRGLADVEAGRGRPLVEFDAEFRAKHNIPSDA
ncbi:MAG: type II toxin-antitoxin system ParD family antitoxin [Pirellulales bacterium]